MERHAASATQRSPDATCAAGIATIVDTPPEAFALAVGCAAVEDLVALSERVGLGPEETAAVLAHAGASPAVAVEVLNARTDGDLHAAVELTTRHRWTDPVSLIESNVVAIDPNSLTGLLIAIGQPDPTSAIGTDLASLRAALPDLTDTSGDVGLELEMTP